MPSAKNASIAEQDPFRVLILGGAYGGLAAALNLLDLCGGKAARFAPEADSSAVGPVTPVQVTIVDERDGFYHLIGSPLTLASKDYMQRFWRRFDEIPALQTPAIRCIRGTPTSIDCQRKVALVDNFGRAKNQQEIEYDFLVTATGLRRVWPVVPQSRTLVDYYSEAGAHVDAVRDAAGAAVIGGGAVGIEIAAELKLVLPDQKVTLIHSRDKLLSSEPLPDDFKDRTLELLCMEGVEIIMGKRVMEMTALDSDSNSSGSPRTKLKLSDGTELLVGHVINAVSQSVPSTAFLPAEVLDPNGYVQIGTDLSFLPSVPNASAHFAVGDATSWSGIKRCGAAMHMGHFAAANIYQRMREARFGTPPSLMTFPIEVPPMIGLAVGKNAIAYSPAEGMSDGKKVLEAFFGNDLGFQICWKYLQLGKESDTPWMN
ncbi:hypothetical protein BDY21DRAFT_387870 [Lineolata rhizophorae]|uniref:FAD/NAD(P)-binding domain-containing protein n=1 Tax=Lineolata rhizophorae TaxID=578093 RepID=A0A6A6NQI8_9PEZI|nr:hypothetical protein BDY21DRAFT_387870 [Lineolata rhizophorae]